MTPSPRRLPRMLMVLIGVVAVVFVGMQAVRFAVPDFQLDNPATTQTVAWSSPEAEQLWTQACADCHSNNTVYPFYAYIAPVGWLVAHDTHEGRDAMNISVDSRIEWDEMVEMIQEGEMPPAIYTSIHTDAILTDAQQQTLIDGIRTTFR